MPEIEDKPSWNKVILRTSATGNPLGHAIQCYLYRLLEVLWRLRIWDDFSVHVTALSLLSSVPRRFWVMFVALGAAFQHSMLPSNAQNLWQDMSFPLLLNFSQNIFYFPHRSVWVPCPASWVALQGGQRGFNCYFVLPITSFLLPSCWRGSLCVHWVSKAHPILSFVHTCLFHCLIILRAEWFQGALLEVDQRRPN